MSQEIFDKLLARIKDLSPEALPPIRLRDAIPESHFPKRPKRNWRDYVFYECRETVIRIMESGIFYDGQLKGRKLKGKDDFEKYPIRDLEIFLLQLATYIQSETKGTLSNLLMEELEGDFLRMAMTLEKIEEKIREFGGKRAVNQVAGIKKELEELKSYAMRKIPRFFPWPDDSDVIDAMLFAFRTQVPGSKPFVRAAVFTFLLRGQAR